MRELGSAHLDDDSSDIGGEPEAHLRPRDVVGVMDVASWRVADAWGWAAL
ncbi:hypothetical protein JKA73_30440 [Myxococcus xanthus]|nr:hypothetical protein [Myxococcus xanthus]QQR43325.1 hypothetical protein JKA73_30440 [Myxococcus xanthus]